MIIWWHNQVYNSHFLSHSHSHTNAGYLTNRQTCWNMSHSCKNICIPTFSTRSVSMNILCTSHLIGGRLGDMNSFGHCNVSTRFKGHFLCHRNADMQDKLYSFPLGASMKKIRSRAQVRPWVTWNVSEKKTFTVVGKSWLMTAWHLQRLSPFLEILTHVIGKRYFLNFHNNLVK